MRTSPSFDVIIIGAGINGAGIARDAAMRGLKVLLLDRGDIGSGTSSSSTRLIHGGLRYLEHGEFGLVHESLRERETLLKIAPHLVRPLPIIIPIYKNGKRGRTTIRAGLCLYDLLSLGKSLPRHRQYSRENTLKQTENLSAEKLVGSVIYFDAQVEFAERLVLENALSARQHGATVITYAHITRLVTAKDASLEVEFGDGSDQLQSARGEIVVNAAGPWVDQLLAQTSTSSPTLIGGTKGSHLIVAPFEGAPEFAVYAEAQSDGRPFFIIPWNGNYLIGTTDVRIEDDIDSVRCESWEVDYLLEETNRILSSARLSRKQVLFTYCGVRPLPFTDDRDEQSITRRHFVRQHPQLNNLLSIVGGKLTTYRSLAEECVDLLFKKLGRRSPACATASSSLPGGAQADSLDFGSLPQKVTTRLLRIYGGRTAELAQLCNDEPALSRPFNRAGDALAAEVVFAFNNEFATTLSDCLMRRTMVGLNRELGVGDDEAAAEVAKQFLGWTDERAKKEVASHREYIRRFAVPMSDTL